MARPRLLFVAPVMPADSGNGLAMRAGLFLDAAASAFEVVLLVVPVFSPPADGGVTSFVSDRATRIEVPPLAALVDPYYALIARLKEPAARCQAYVDYPQPLLTRFATNAAARAAAQAVAGERFDLVHVMRLYLAPFAAPYLAAAGERPVALLDLDDDEVATHGRIAALHTRRGETREAQVESADSRKYMDFERRWLPRFDRVMVAAPRDRAAIRERLGMPGVEVVPNAVRIPREPRNEARGDESVHRLLFVGSLGYVPNEDAAMLLCDEVLPGIRALTDRPVTLDLVGARPSIRVQRLAERPGVCVSADVADVARRYRDADLVVTPIRAGGGTRIKLLEAFAHRVPVVSTTIGAEGLEVAAGRELLIADEPTEIAAACVRVLTDPRLAGDLRRFAAAFVASRHDWTNVARDIRTGYERARTGREADAREVPSPHDAGWID